MLGEGSVIYGCDLTEKYCVPFNSATIRNTVVEEGKNVKERHRKRIGQTQALSLELICFGKLELDLEVYISMELDLAF